MQLRYGLLADHANATQDGKVNIIGVVDRLYATQFPAMHRELFLITSFITEAEDDNSTQDVHIQLIDPDGKSITELRGQFQIGQGKQILNQLNVFQDITFNAPGGYQFNIFLNGKMVKSLDLELQFLPQQVR